MLSTENIGLKKPGYNDEADIAIINENMDTIDAELNNRYPKNQTYSNGETDEAIATAINALPRGLIYRGAVNYYNNLPTENNELGDTYSVKYQGTSGTEADGNEYAWGEYDGTLQWIKLGVNAYNKDEIDEQREAIESDILSAERAIEINQRTLGAQATKNVLKINSLNQTKNGITITTNEDRSISIEGKATTETYFSINANVTVPKTANYTLTGCPSGGSNLTYQLYLTGDVEIYDKGKGDTKRITTSQKCTAYIAIYPTDENLDITFYPMLRETDITDDTYEPYKPSLQEQINALVERIQALETAQTQAE